jgi:hypothetical protein
MDKHSNEPKVVVELSPEDYVKFKKLLHRRWYQRWWFWFFFLFLMFGVSIKESEMRERHFCNLARATGHFLNFPHCLLVKP